MFKSERESERAREQVNHSSTRRENERENKLLEHVEMREDSWNR